MKAQGYELPSSTEPHSCTSVAVIGAEPAPPFWTFIPTTSATSRLCASATFRWMKSPTLPLRLAYCAQVASM
jgi:hypothetical protein